MALNDSPSGSWGKDDVVTEGGQSTSPPPHAPVSMQEALRVIQRARSDGLALFIAGPQLRAYDGDDSIGWNMLDLRKYRSEIIIWLRANPDLGKGGLLQFAPGDGIEVLPLEADTPPNGADRTEAEAATPPSVEGPPHGLEEEGVPEAVEDEPDPPEPSTDPVVELLPQIEPGPDLDSKDEPDLADPPPWAEGLPPVTAADYVRAGFALVPIPFGLKNPVTDGWQLEVNAIRTPEKAASLVGCNIGLAHLWSGTCAIDADDYVKAVAWLAPRGADLPALLASEDAVLPSSGRENRAKALYRLPPGVPWLPTHKISEAGLELRCASRDGQTTAQDVIPPSTHPDTLRPYFWAGLGTWRNLPVLPAEVLKVWREIGANGAASRPPRTAQSGPVPEGGRDDHLASLGGSMRRRGMSEAAIYAALEVVNREQCDPSLPEADVRRIARIGGAVRAGGGAGGAAGGGGAGQGEGERGGIPSPSHRIPSRHPPIASCCRGTE